ncbi:hypothetical protein NDK47_16065 [Brevibacillus ruminantium]|uniref:Uncharacterized protein n=1 Tax=Brevibacillus ruminantium TaxID=2950604 RepID=A0ABY4WA94_9BACL|nr:hypothetical protein [Brevibacillus ruminantium]USG63689.1 hypothetical protein NDK47_16065 [Brevibacillus ruminantium]
MILLDQLYQRLMEELFADGFVAAASWREYAGRRFLYVRSPLTSAQLSTCLTAAGERITAGTVIQPECIYVRTTGEDQVFRFRFVIPEDKKFCCGNLCEDCFLFRSQLS